MGELDLPYNTKLIKEEKIVDHTRWSGVNEIVFHEPNENKYYRTHYSVGATESQDERPWEYEDAIDCIEVELKEVTTKKWVEI